MFTRLNSSRWAIAVLAVILGMLSFEGMEDRR